MKERKLEITKKLEDIAHKGVLDDIVAILNLPSANYCEKRAERVLVNNRLQQSCFGCISQDIRTGSALSLAEIKDVIDIFARDYETRFITINGRGDPFHSRLKSLNLSKVRYAFDKYGIQSYIFTSGNNLDNEVCSTLVGNDANIMISLFGNQFIDADFFAGREYTKALKPLQNQAEIADNLRRLIQAYREHPNQPEQGTTRIGINYVVSERDFVDKGTKVKDLKQATNDNGLFFVCNLPFQENPDKNIQELLKDIARAHSNFNLPHSTVVNGQCQMGAGSSVTIDYDGTMYRCPYMDIGGDGKIQNLGPKDIHEVVMRYMKNKGLCVIRLSENE